GDAVALKMRWKIRARASPASRLLRLRGAEGDAQVVDLPIVDQRDRSRGVQRVAVQLDALHAGANPIGILHADLVAGGAFGAMTIGDLESRPCLWQAWSHAQPIAPQPEPEHGLQRGAVQPRSRAGVPGPAAAADVRRHRIDVRADHVRFHLVARDRLGAVAVMDRVEQVEQRAGAVAVAEAGPGEDRPDRAMRILPTVLAHAGRIALDVAGILLAVLVERRREQARQLVLVVDEQLVDRGHRLRRMGAVAAGDHAPRLGDRIDPALFAVLRAERRAIVVVAAAI